MDTDGVKSYNAPNPFNPSTMINYTLDEPSEVNIRIYNINGQLVRSFDQGYQSTGMHSIQWSGQDDSGDQVPSGTYLYQIQAGDAVSTKHMVLLK